MHLKDFLKNFVFYIKFQLLSSLKKIKLLSKCQKNVTKTIENKNKS